MLLQRFLLQALLLTTFTIAYSGFVFAQLHIEKNETAFDQYISEYQRTQMIPSISAGIYCQDKIVWLGAAGYSDIENFVPASTKSVYRIASISKSITAVAILQLVERGKINPDEDIRNYVPYYPKKRWKVTTRHLLNHTSGVRTYREGEFDSKAAFASTRQALSIILQDTLLFQPGTKYLYTTYGYNLLAAIIEGASGISYVDYIKRNILIPCEMNSTYPDIHQEIIYYRARGYRRNDYRKLENAPLADLSIKLAGGGLIFTADDLLKFGSKLLDGKLISQPYLDSLMMPTRLRNGQIINYGYGFSLGTDTNGRKFISHQGGGTGFSSNIVLFPDEKLISVHLVNLRDREKEHPTLRRLNHRQKNVINPAEDLALIFRNEVTRPLKYRISDRLMAATLASGIDSSLSLYKTLFADSAEIYFTNEEELLLFGFDLLKLKRTREAITAFRFFTAQNPESANLYIGLAEAYNLDGNKGLALRNYRIALRLNPQSNYASEMIQKQSGN